MVKRSKLTPRTLTARFKKVRLLVCDVDGVLTDGGIQILEKSEMKRFHVTDGLAQRCCQKMGVKVAWVTARPSAVTKKRAQELDTDFLIQTTKGKVPAVDSIRKKLKLTWDEICFIGDDLVDLAVMQKVGIAIAPATACAEAIDVAHHVTKAGGGNGAVRELVEKILKAQGKWAKVVSQIAQ